MPEKKQTQSRANQASVMRGPGPGPRAITDVVHAQDARGTLHRIWTYLKHQRNQMILFCVLVALSSGLGLVGPYLIGVTLDQVLSTGSLRDLGINVVLLAGNYIVLAAITWLQSYVMAGISQATVFDMRQDLYARLESLSLRFYDTHQHGDIMSRLTNDIETVAMSLSESLPQFVSSVLMLIGVTIAMFVLNVWMALVTMLIVPLLMVITRYVAKHTRKGFRERQASLGQVNGIIEETVSGQRVVKAFGREQSVLDEFAVANDEFRRTSRYAQAYAGVMGPIGGLTNNINKAVVAIAGGVLAVRGVVTIGTIATFTNYANQFGRPINGLAQLFGTIQSAIAGAERVFQTLDEIPELADGPDAVPLEEIAGDVVFDDVSFAYEEDKPVLKNVSFHAEPGQTFALVGPTGAGKTTIVNLLTRFYDIDAGTIYVDGVDIRDAQKDTLRRQLGIVLQDNYLFADTVMANLRYGRLDATDGEVRQAAMLANADGFIRHMPQGYDSELAERGANLSQGQRQLLSIARAMLADPRILILDEATSSVDTRTEKHIQEALLKLMEGRTSFVIAHRLSTIRDADCVLVVDEGEIVERGTHEELLAMKGFYWNLYMSQFRGTTLVAA